MTQGDKLKVFPSMTQYGWCFVVDLKDDKRRGWVPGSLKAAFFFAIVFAKKKWQDPVYFGKNRFMYVA
jgi:hypothetical protein